MTTPLQRSQDLVATLLGEIASEAILVQFASTLDEASYEFRLELPGQLGKPLRLARQLLEQAASGNQRSRDSVRGILETELRFLRAQREHSQSRLGLTGPIGPPAASGVATPPPPGTGLISGTVEHVDRERRIVRIGGAELFLGEDTVLDDVFEGTSVIATFQSREGRWTLALAQPRDPA